MKIEKLILFFIFLCLFKINAQTPAFPGAEGHGRYTTGGRGGDVYYVNTLEDNKVGDSKAKEGSLRWCLGRDGKKVILFKVAGTIYLQSPLKINKGDVTIAGQSAPGDGICIANYPLSIASGVENVVIRYIRVRLGDLKMHGEEAANADAMSGKNARNIIIDHCSVSWCMDECASFYHNENFTMQWCIISESMRLSNHAKGPHGYGGIWGGKNASFHHNLLAHHDSRNPRLGEVASDTFALTDLVDVRNNVIYNWSANACYAGEGMNVNIVNCYYKLGPASPSSKNVKAGRIISIDKNMDAGSPLYNRWGKFYVNGNKIVDKNDNSTGYTLKSSENNWDYGVFNQFSDRYGAISETDKQAIRMLTPHNPGIITTHSAAEAYQKVLAYAGCSYKRDFADIRIIEETRTGTATYKGKSPYNGLGKTTYPIGTILANGEKVEKETTIDWKSKDYPKPGIIDSQKDVEGWPVLTPGSPVIDDDKDGIKDGWLEKNYPGKKATDFNEEGYTYLEVYLNSLVSDITKNQQ